MCVCLSLSFSFRCLPFFPGDGGQHADPAVLQLRLSHPVDRERVGDAQRIEALLLAHPALQDLEGGESERIL